MSQVIIEDPAWKAIMADPELERARQKLSFHEIRLIMKHAVAAKAELSAERASSILEETNDGL